MLHLDIPRICTEKGIPNHKKFLLSLGFYPNAAALLLKLSRKRLDYDQIEKLCMALRCTPNDLFNWKPGADGADASHPMHALLRPEKPSITAMLRNLPPEKIEQVREMMMQLSQEDKGQ